MAQARITVTIDPPDDDDSGLFASLDFADSEWEETGDETPWSRLTLKKHLKINGCVLRVEARAVVVPNSVGGGASEMTAVEWPEDLDSIYSVSTADGPLDTTTIKGVDYIVIALPVS